MPERVKTKFTDTEPDLAKGKPLKRNATQAFEDGRQHQSNSILEKHRDGRPQKANTINFPDDNQRAEPKPNQSFVRSDRGPRNSSGEIQGRLKQRASNLLKVRQQLPIWSYASEIRDKVATNDVLLLVGETGSGKSTQIPQFLLPLCQTSILKAKSKVGGCIAITQPRKVAAISLARRVAEEMGTPLGNSSPASQVGYSVRFDTSTSPSTKVKFLTDGMLLQELVRDPWLKEYSVVVVDEVHERGVNVDLVLGFLQRLIVGRKKSDGRGGVPLKVVVMSATADMEKIQQYFDRHSAIPPDNVSDLDEKVLQGDETTWNGFSDNEEKQAQSKTLNNIPTRVSSCSIKGRQYPVALHYLPAHLAETMADLEVGALDRITAIHTHTPLPGDILVFLQGQEVIEKLESMCVRYAQSLDMKSKQKGAPRIPKLLILPLYAALPTAAQQRVFDSTPPFTRKIILSTNIAETSVTVPGIRHVIDTGKRKARVFRPGLNLDTLLTTRISRSSAGQRTGRAGREAPGNCYRLYTEKTFYEFEADTEPEILRCDLSQVVLTLKAHNIENPLTFPLLTPLPQKSLKRALLHLLGLEALDKGTGSLTKKGRQMSTLPVPAHLASILLASIEPQYDCLNEMIDIVSALSVENIWLPIHKNGSDNTTAESENAGNSETDNENEHDSANPIIKARKSLFTREGDHLTLLKAMQSYDAEQTDRKEWCRRYGISHRAMTSAFEARKQLKKLMLKSCPPRPSSSPNNERDNQDQPLSTRILRALLTGLREKLAYLSTSTTNTNMNTNTNTNTKTNMKNSNIWVGPYCTVPTSTDAAGAGKNLSIHPSSVLFARSRDNKPGYIMFSEYVVTKRAYARCVSVVEKAWIDTLYD